MSKAAVSRHFGQVEARLGARLLHRTRRRLSLTEEGEVFYARCKSLLAEIEEAEAEISERGGDAIGLLRINAPLTFGILHLAELWGHSMRCTPTTVIRAGSAALLHRGIVLQPTFLVGPDIEAGRLVEVLPEHRSVGMGVHVVVSARIDWTQICVIRRPPGGVLPDGLPGEFESPVSFRRQ